MSVLVPYLITDFYWDNIDDQIDRFDVTTSGTLLRPKLVDDPLTARQRFTKFQPSKLPPRPLDLTDAPKTFTNATQNAPETPTTKDRGPRYDPKALLLSHTLHHYDRPKEGGSRL